MREHEHIKTFSVLGDKVVFTSMSGNDYVITKTSCSCKGFAFRRKCSHYEEAKSSGLLDSLNDKSYSQVVSRALNVKLRREALRVFLKKYDVKFNEVLIRVVEPRITQLTKPEQVIDWASHFNAKQE